MAQPQGNDRGGGKAEAGHGGEAPREAGRGGANPQAAHAPQAARTPRAARAPANHEAPAAANNPKARAAQANPRRGAPGGAAGNRGRGNNGPGRGNTAGNHMFTFRGQSHAGLQLAPFQYPSGYRYRRWSSGQHLPALFLTAPYFFDEFAGLGLETPPPGYRWVRYGPDALLVNIRTRDVEDVAYGVFY
jgi:Ni/Co efflux regulator RcnB